MKEKDQKWYFVFSKTLLFFLDLLGWMGEYNIFFSRIENFSVRKRLKALHDVEAGAESNRFSKREREWYLVEWDMWKNGDRKLAYMF